MNLKNGSDRCVKIVGFGLGCVMDINRVTAARNFPNGFEWPENPSGAVKDLP